MVKSVMPHSLSSFPTVYHFQMSVILYCLLSIHICQSPLSVIPNYLPYLLLPIVCHFQLNLGVVGFWCYYRDHCILWWLERVYKVPIHTWWRVYTISSRQYGWGGIGKLTKLGTVCSSKVPICNGWTVCFIFIRTI